jgi:peptidoglycan lytic transglycosylase G
MAGRGRAALAILGVIAVLVAGILAFVGNRVWREIHQPFKGYQDAEQFVDIPSGSSTGEIRRRLIESGVVSNEFALRAALWWSGRSRSLKAGEYRFDRAMTAVEVVDKLTKGDVYTRRITFPEGLTIREMAMLYESNRFGPARDFLRAASDPALIKDLDPKAPDLEGYLFPETYALARTTPATRLVELMVERFRSTHGEIPRQGGQPLTTRQLVTLASLVEKETGAPPERPLVSAVYRNRMKIGMGMQADPTVVYALIKAGRYDGNIRRADLDFDSPYNTYKYSGLPPGPIASPGRASLEAAAAPADVPYLYFVSRNDGTHVFAETLAQHNANVYRYQVQYFRELRLKGAREKGEGGRAVRGGKQ